ncbi:probable RNA polymerase II nuclear localization protein SLC7A6OS [Lingula anatina]|uniref:Probable RNA polymerase II nuclear localization protein SLC7A6OS n=1 Tax=Lingula anatina TaxID=7574 RepID=A0A1S3KAZ5_LINAN|nr:probable RNA polymerase II nuclear localization protein SLC7A6OS [Lingula anatina]|eukprot:XP_013419662.1 probable RNA polymerase II nuclear localization protein SLC7A6OS [Lingula anatina]
MATIVRVKRRRHDDPLDSLVLACKKPKRVSQPLGVDDDDDEEVKSIFSFAGTVQKKNEPVSRHVKEAIRKKKLEKEYKQHSTDFLKSARRKQKDVIKNNRFKVTAGHRSMDLNNLDVADDQTSHGACKGTEVEQKDTGLNDTSFEKWTQKCYQIYDLEEEEEEDASKEKQAEAISSQSAVACNGVPMIREKIPQSEPQDTDFVYDIYYSNCADFDFRSLENLLTVEAYGEEYVYDDYREPMDREIYEDEDDSNEEDNWRNDYPDEDPEEGGAGDGFESDGEPLSRRLVRGLRLGDEDLSSDEEDLACFGQGLYTTSWTPQSSYENYRRKMASGLYEDDDGYDIDEIDEYS